MQRINIAICCDAINFVAGCFVSTIRFAERLSKKGNKVILISSRYPGTAEIEKYKGMKLYRLSAFPVPKSKKKLYFAYPHPNAIQNILKKEKIDVLHFMVPTPLSISAVSAAKKLGIKVVGHSHTQPENWAVYLPKIFEMTKGTLIELSYDYIIKLFERSDAVICPSRFAEKMLLTRGLKRKTYVISNGVDTKKFRKKDSSDCLKKYRLSPGKKKMLFVGRLDPEKNIPVLIHAMKYIERKFSDFEVCIVGAGTMQRELEGLAKALNVHDKVKFLGRVTDKELVGIYNMCDIFVLPSLVELEGMVVLEAMSCGKPLLIANSPDSASSLFISKNGFLFDPNNPKDLALKALKILQDDKLSKRMSVESYAKSKEYDINKSVSRLEEVYAEIIGA